MTQFEVWAQISLTAEDTQHIQNFFEVDFGIRHKFVARHPHLTVYHARRPMPGLRPSCENIHIVVPTSGTRFMILAPGGENPRPELDPGILKVGIRIQRQNPAMVRILEIRHRLTAYETADVLGKRAPSTDKRNAFGARTFQPHVALLRAGSRIDRDLTRVGQRFHEQISELRFDIFAIDIVKSKPANINRA